MRSRISVMCIIKMVEYKLWAEYICPTMSKIFKEIGRVKDKQSLGFKSCLE